ncbi:hypothetical protein BEP19_06765 [Ammoniphilus oxalaticus]|uniref:DUF881 domain-containing protein n=1 Tax=Ammoniphilus oxalaticus TaxID=66863 RepID=A0A419SJF0_9BACL|nr:DUF881 domain-containing protein [Ammoniphilus oxalaticus]RKD24105.1 hypothetical protein BEP19_06765 [Ammoniphilus oxalaticus]
MRTTSRIPFTITVISIIIGFMLAIQFNTNNKSTGAESKDMSLLRQDLQKVMEQHQRILADIVKYDQLLFEYKNPANQENSLNLMIEELERVKAFGGLAPIEGKGLLITIAEIEDPLDDAFSSLIMIYDGDLRLVVNELFGAGALAIAINDNRMTPQSSIRDVGEEIQVNTKVVRPPFEIKVIGDPEVLESAMKLKGFEEFFKVFNYSFSMKKLDKINVPAYDGKGSIRYMKPLKEGS